MSRSRNDIWGDPYEMPDHQEASWTPEQQASGEAASKYLEEAHEALSKFMNHTKKRGKETRQARRGESWH